MVCRYCNLHKVIASCNWLLLAPFSCWYFIVESVNSCQVLGCHAVAGLQVSILAHVDHVDHAHDSGGSSPEVDLMSNESFSWHPSSQSEEEDFDE